MTPLNYQSFSYSRVPNQDATLFILKTLYDEYEYSGREFMTLEMLLHKFMYYGQNDLRLSYKSALKRFNGAAYWLYMHGSVSLVGEESISINHDKSNTKPSRSDIKVFKYALCLAGTEFNKSVKLGHGNKLAHI